MGFAYDIKDVTLWLVELGGDGTMWSFLVKGKIEHVEAALISEECGEYIEDLQDENNWDHYGVFYLELEQSYMRVSPVRDHNVRGDI